MPQRMLDRRALESDPLLTGLLRSPTLSPPLKGPLSFLRATSTVMTALASTLVGLGCVGEPPTSVDGVGLDPQLVVSERKESYDSYVGTQPTAAEQAAAIMTAGASSFMTNAVFTGAGVQAAVLSSPVQGFPTQGNSYLVLSSGIAALTPGVATTFVSNGVGGPSLPGGTSQSSPDGLNSLDVATLALTFDLPMQPAALTFDWRFGTDENPTFTLSFPDYFRADIFTPDGAVTNIAVLANGNPVTVTNARLFSNAPTGSSNIPGPPFPTPDDVVYNAVTANTTKAAINLAAFRGQTITLQLRMADVNDTAINSAAFIDNLDIDVDTDGDGTPNSLDDRPNEFGPPDNAGCPRPEVPEGTEISSDPSSCEIDVDGKFGSNGCVEWADITPVVSLGGESIVYQSLDPDGADLYPMCDFIGSQTPLEPGEESGQVRFFVGEDVFDVSFIQGGRNSTGGEGDEVRVLRNALPFDNALGSIEGAVDFNRTSPSFAQPHNLFELEVRLLETEDTPGGSPPGDGGLYSPDPAFWGAALPGSPLVQVSSIFLDIGTGGVVTALVLPLDVTPPEISFDLDATELWPPNHKMVTVATGIGATDDFDPIPIVSVSVTSNEPLNGTGDGDTAPDWEITDNGDGTFDVAVRSENAGVGDGRTYTIVVTATDFVGNSATETGTVSVPHDRR